MKAKRLKTKIRSGYNWIESQENNRLAQWLIWGIYTLIIIVFAWQHEPLNDEYHVWGMVFQKSALGLFKAMRHEGHFCLWHFMQWPFVKWLGMDWRSLHVVSIPLMSLAVWLLLFRVEFPFIGKLLVIFSAPFFYYYPVVARCYALIPPILMGLSVLYQRKKHPILYCILLGLLANTHAYMEGLVAVLWCFFVWKHVWKIRKTNPKTAKRNALAATTTLVLVFFAFIQVAMGLLDMANGWRPGGGGPMKPEQWFQRFNYCYQIDICHHIKNYVSASFPDFDLLLTLCGYVMVIILSHLVFQSYDNKRRKESLVILFCALAWQVFFASNLYGPHRNMTLLLCFSLLAVWLFNYPFGKPKYICLTLFFLWLLHTSSSFDAIKDLWVTIDPSVSIAKKIDSDMPDDCDTLYINHWVINDLIPRKKVWLSQKRISKLNKAEKVDAWCLILGEEPIQLENCTIDEVGSYQIHLAYIPRFDGQKLHLYHITK